MLYEWLAPWKLWGVVVFAPTAGWIRDCWKNQHRYHKYLDPYKHKQQQYMGNRWFKCCITKALPEFFDDSKYTKTTDEAFLWVARVARDAGPFRLEWWVRRVCHWAQSGWYLRWWSRKSATFIYTGEGYYLGYPNPKSLWISICSYGMLWSSVLVRDLPRLPSWGAPRAVDSHWHPHRVPPGWAW